MPGGVERYMRAVLEPEPLVSLQISEWRTEVRSHQENHASGSQDAIGFLHEFAAFLQAQMLDNAYRNNRIEPGVGERNVGSGCNDAMGKFGRNRRPVNTFNGVSLAAKKLHQ